MQKSIIDKLVKEFGSAVLFDEPMSCHTSWKVGGPADALLYATCEEDILRVLRFTYAEKIPLQVIGNGSNLLVGDGGIRGLVLEISDKFSHCEWSGQSVTVQAGAMLAAVAKEACEHNLTGLEFAGGIPGTIGGALIMNAGAFGGNIGPLVTKVELAEYTGKKKVLLAEDLSFAYRNSNLASFKGVILSVSLALQAGDGSKSRAALQEHLAYRAAMQPLEYPSCGSVFRNPEGDHAGRLIEISSLRGKQIGGAQVSDKHGNFIVNRGGAKASDIRQLMAEVADTVEKLHGVRLQPEVRMIGEFL
ncbi:MAG: UDP-N-acetylmuramate dehydrogenase [Clostridia bacterium]|nr:UDP-N-acetylmuramate dehydrogenase [Clostridia bacterium]MDD4798253.1 UDP-N-acetylmuramate dehydrogenase [Clostridia bacterium]